MSERLQALQALLKSQQIAAQDSMVGRTVKVLFEKKGREDGQLIGKSEYLHAIYADAPEDALGDIRDVYVAEAGPNSLAGRLVA